MNPLTVTVTPGNISVIIQLPEAGVTLIACRGTGNIQEVRRALRTMNVTKLLCDSLLQASGERVPPTGMTLSQSFHVRKRGDSDLYAWNIPQAGLVLTAWCAKAMTKNAKKEQQNALKVHDISQILLKNFFPKKT